MLYTKRPWLNKSAITGTVFLLTYQCLWTHNHEVISRKSLIEVRYTSLFLPASRSFDYVVSNWLEAVVAIDFYLVLIHISVT